MDIMKRIVLFLLILLPALASCHNSDQEFPGFGYSTVYFSYQYPDRTVTLGEITQYDNTLDNQHKVKIMGTWGGGYTTRNDVTIDFRVDNSLCEGLVFEDSGRDVLPMPSTYYKLASERITIPKGSIAGGVEVSLTDEFFADPLALQRNYVIPLVMTGVQGADSILQGNSDFPDEARRVVAGDWNIVPKDYILYAVKYINPWDANYLRRGKDVITENGTTIPTEPRHSTYVEYDELCKLNTLSLTELEFPLPYRDAEGNDLNVSLILTFDDNGNCTVRSGTENVTASGTGSYVPLGEKNSWAAKDRDALYLDYRVDLGSRQYHTLDTLVVRDRGIATSAQFFTVVLK